jgi:hypothetical protein
MHKLLTGVLLSLAVLGSACGPGTNATVEESSVAEVESTTEPTAAPTTGTTAEATTDDTSASTTTPPSDAVRTDDPTLKTQTLGSGILAKTLEPADGVSSARFLGTFSFVGTADSEMPGEFTLTFSGAYDLPNEASQVSMDFGDLAMASAGAGDDGMAMFAAFFAEPLEIITIGEKAWIKWGFLSLFGAPDGMWLETAADESDGFTSDFGFGGSGSPTELLDMLSEASARLDVVGTEKVRGVSTTHYRALIDTEALAQDMNAAERAEFEEELGARPIGDLPIEFWLDDEGMLRKYLIDLSDPDMFTEDDQIESAQMAFEIWDYGADLGITPPPADQIMTEDDLAFDLTG